MCWGGRGEPTREPICCGEGGGGGGGRPTRDPYMCRGREKPTGDPCAGGRGEPTGSILSAGRDDDSACYCWTELSIYGSTFPFASACTGKHKSQVKKTTQKSKSLRKQLYSDC